jgi:hypothetical protein
MKLQTTWPVEGGEIIKMLKMKDDPDELLKTKGQKSGNSPNPDNFNKISNLSASSPLSL